MYLKKDVTKNHFAKIAHVTKIRHFFEVKDKSLCQNILSEILKSLMPGYSPNLKNEAMFEKFNATFNAIFFIFFKM